MKTALAALHAGRPDVIAFTGGGLLRKQVLRSARLGVLNCHLGILPSYRGMDVVEWPWVESRHDERIPRVGLTVHFMDSGVDTGPILLTRFIPVRLDDTFTSIRIRLEPMMVRMMLETVTGLRDGTLHARPQPHDDGRQYYVMHPRIQTVAERRLAQHLAASHGGNSAHTVTRRMDE